MSSEKKITEKGYWECQNPNIYKFDKGLAQTLAQFFGTKQSVIDLGCGNGAYTKYLNEHGVNCYGCDGNPYTPEIAPGCGVCDLTARVNELKRDYVLCLEVAEHIPKEYESMFLYNIKNLSRKGIVLSWAVRGQGGHGHINEQENAYVQELMKGFKRNVKWEEKMRNNAVFPYFKNTIMIYETRN